MIRLPLSSTPDVLAAFADVRDELDRLSAPLVDLHGRRFVNAGASIEPADFATLDDVRGELERRGVNDPGSTSRATVLRTSDTTGATARNLPNGAVLFGLNGGLGTDPLQFFYNNTSNRLGLGTNAPGTQAEFRGPVGVGAASAGILTLSTAELTVVAADRLGQINFQAPLESSGTDAILAGASIWAAAEGTFGAASNATALVFATAASAAPTEKMRITSAGYVGINTDVPDSRLHVFNGSAGTVAPHSSADDFIIENAGGCGMSIITPDANDGRIVWSSPSTTANLGCRVMFNYDANLMTIGQIAGGAAVYLQGANVGIGTAVPTVPLEASGSLSSNGTEEVFRISGSTGVSSAATLRATATYAASAGARYFGLDSLDEQDQAAPLVLNAIGGGSVGVGTLVPRVKFEGSGSLASGGTEEVFRFSGNSASTQTATLRGTASHAASAALRYFSLDSVDEQGQSSPLVLNTVSTGFVGVNTTAPDGRLHVHSGSAGTVVPHSSADDFVIENSAGAGMSIITPDANDGRIIWQSPSRTSNIGARISFNYNADLMTLGPAGGILSVTRTSLGIGKAPSVVLDVNGAIAGTTLNTGQGANELYDMDQNVKTTNSPTFFALTITNGLSIGAGDRLYLDGGSNSYIFEPAGDVVRLVCGGTNVVTWRTTGVEFDALPTTGSAANLYASGPGGALARSTSSRRYKRDVQDLATDWRVLLAMRPVSYRGKNTNDGDTQFPGFVAEEVAAVAPLFATYDTDGRPDYVMYDRLTTLLVAGMQAHEKRLATLDGGQL